MNQHSELLKLKEMWRRNEMEIEDAKRERVSAQVATKSKAQTEQETIDAATATVDAAMAMGDGWLKSLGADLPISPESNTFERCLK